MRVGILVFLVLYVNCFPQNTKIDSVSNNFNITIINSKVDEKFDIPSKNEDNFFLKIIDFISNPFVSAALASLLTFYVTHYFNNRQKKKDELLNYRATLLTTKNELDFYLQKLTQLKTEANNIVNSITSGSSPIIPTYSLYPKFLESSKISLNKFYKNPDLVKRIGHCHFELSHICERLELVKKELRSSYNPKIQAPNVLGFQKLVESNITEFEGMISDINKELEKMRQKL